MQWKTLSRELPLAMVLLGAWVWGSAHGQGGPNKLGSVGGTQLSVEVYDDGFYALRSRAIPGDVLRAEVEADTATGVLRSSAYPRHTTETAAFHDELGAGRILTVTHSGLAGAAELICEFRVYENQPWGDIRVRVRNSTSQPIEVHSIRVLKSAGQEVLRLDGPDQEDRVLSDSFSEDSPVVKVVDLGATGDGVHRAFGSQLIYNRRSGQSLFLGALSAGRLLTVFHLRTTRQAGGRMVSYEVEDTGTNEALREQSAAYGAENSVPLALDLAPGESMETERLMFSIGTDYHAQLQNYGRAIRILDNARVSTPTLIGWWSWTAYYYGVTEGTVLTNAAWLEQNLLPLGYRYFQIDEGYQYARGEFGTANGIAFPRGMGYVGDQISRAGLTFGLWVAPFQVSERSFVYDHHKDWLVRNLKGEPIHLGKLGGRFDELYALDTTNPGAQEYLRQTYHRLVKEWGARFLKLDFMDSAAVEGVRYRPQTTALEALRTGLEVIRAEVGDDVVLDKDGSPMLTPVGIVDTGRISQDTGHTFGSTRDAAPGIAARYYMHRNFFESDPDAFTVSKQVVPDRGWHGNKVPLTQDEAEASIALSAVSGGMFEIGDDLPALGASPERLALVKNADLLDMARMGKASTPMDLMTYRPEDKQPSIFLLNEDNRQRILTVFNWTEGPQSHMFRLEDLGFGDRSAVRVVDVLRGGAVKADGGQFDELLSPHSVRMLKVTNTSIPEAVAEFDLRAPAAGKSGASLEFSALTKNESEPILGFVWEFGDGVKVEGSKVIHTYTQPGQYSIRVTASGLNGRTAEKTLVVTVTGYVPTVENPAAKQRFKGEQ